jgi:hypothetical protein
MIKKSTKSTSMQKRKGPADPPKGNRASTLSMGDSKADASRFGKKEQKPSRKPQANIFISDSEAKSKRSALAKDLRTGKISKAQYDKGMGSARTKNDIKNLEKNAGGSGVKAQKGGSAMKAETRSRSCSKPGKGF